MTRGAPGRGNSPALILVRLVAPGRSGQCRKRAVAPSIRPSAPVPALRRLRRDPASAGQLTRRPPYHRRGRTWAPCAHCGTLRTLVGRSKDGWTRHSDATRSWRASPHSTTRSPARSSTACPQDWRTLYVRELLVSAGVLPMRQENFARLRLWLRVRLANLPPHHARVTANDRVDIRTAITFMTWLDDNSITLADLSQEVLDLWLTSHPPRPIGLHPLGRRPPSDGHQRPLRHPPPHRLRPFPVHPEQLDDIPRSSHRPRKPLVLSWLR